VPSGDHVEIDISRQVTLYVRGGEVIGIWPTSTGAPGNDTPRGAFRVYRKDAGWECGDLGCLFKPSYFIGGYAIHGYPSVPTYPASHGCSRVPMSMTDWVYDSLPVGFEVLTYV
jgi:lipoprotein-anchoring transpeptidase ErfK/SrfK